jgi:DNA modification methylase
MVNETAPVVGVTLCLAIIYRPVSELKPSPRNPRRHERKQIRKIVKSIETFGFVAPILINRDGEIIAGHGRWLAAKELGLDQVPTICLGHLSEQQVKALLLADNRLAELATWDDRLLAESLKELSAADPDFDIEITGFDMGEIDVRIQGLESLSDGEEDPDDRVPPPQGPAIARPGDLWVLGRHRLLCGSALDQSAYAAVMQGELATAVFTDPPYNVKIEGNVSGLGAVQHREFAMASGEMDAGQFTEFLAKAFILLAQHSADGSLHYICMDWRHLAELSAASHNAYSELKNLCVWAKDNAGMGSFYRSQHELVFVFKKGTAPHINNVELGRHGRYRTNIWQYPGANSFAGRKCEEGDLLALHPTVKPVALVADVILDCTKRNDIVLDAFLGSGTTVIAAERTGRRCYGLEFDPCYVDTIIRRWQAYTGDDARHAVTHHAFNDLLEETEKSVVRP